MNDTPLGPGCEKMIAALYGELPPDEMSSFLATLEEDEALKNEWEELQDARTFLQRADQESIGLPFQFLMPAGEAGAAGSRTGTDNGRPFQVEPQPAPGTHRFRRLVLTPAAGFATMAVALLILMFAGLRIDASHGALTLHFGESPRANLPGGAGLEPPPGQNLQTVAAERPVSGSEDPESYVTRADLALFADQFLRLMDDQLIAARQQQRGEFVFLLNELTESLNERERINRARLDSRFEEVCMGVVGMVRAQENAAQSWPSSDPAGVSATPVHQTTPNREESGTND